MTKVAIVTASDSGIGKTTALMLAERGFDIGVTGTLMNKGRGIPAAKWRRRDGGLKLSTLI